MKLHTLLALGQDVIALQETDVAECDVTWLKAQAAGGGPRWFLPIQSIWQLVKA